MKSTLSKPWHYLAMGACCGLAVVMSLLFCAALGARWIAPAEPVLGVHAVGLQYRGRCRQGRAEGR